MTEFRKRLEGERKPIEGLPPWMSELLQTRGIDTAEKAEHFLHPSLSDLHDPMLMQGMDRALELIRAAVAGGEKILIYGDYDVDGISACTVLLETLKEVGADASFRIPARHTEGYGLNADAVRAIGAEGCGLLITVDCGISNHEEVALARKLGMKVIVTDHHELPETLPKADAVLDPLLGDYPFRHLCGAGVALKICQALQGPEGVEKRLEVAALATVADIVPLTGENRVIVREGMLRMAHTARPGLRALMETAGVTPPVRADQITYRLGPRLNAAGRLEDAAQGVRLLMTRDETEAREIAEHLEDNNRRRQETERGIVAEALKLFPEQTDLKRERVIILEGEGWNSGLIGLAAGRLCERFHHPTVVLSRQGDNAVGSCRSVEGVNIWKMLSLCSDLFIRFGGHEQAAGLTIPVRNIPEFRCRLNRIVQENCDDGCLIPVEEYDSVLPLDEATQETVRCLEALEPTGCGNPEPRFLLRDAFVQEMHRVGKDRSHLKMALADRNAVRDAIAFGLGEEADRIPDRVDVIYRPELNEYNGRTTVQMRISAVRPAEKPEDGEEKQTRFLRILQEMSRISAKRMQSREGLPSLKPEYLLKERADALQVTDEALREIYKSWLVRPAYSSLRELCELAGVSGEQALTALTAFRETGLMTWRYEPFEARLVLPARKCSMNDSPLIRYLRENAGHDGK